MGALPMASWGLTCKGCGQTFTYSKISERLVDYFLPAKPEIAAEGVERECPNCKAKCVYKRNELTYNSPENS
jgi:hypothetical protein